MRAEACLISWFAGCLAFSPATAQPTGQIQSVRLLTRDRLELQISGPTDRVHVIETSPDLDSWDQAIQLQAVDLPPDGLWVAEFPLGSNQPALFYRAVFIEPGGNPVLLTSLPGDPLASANGLLPELAMPEEADSEVTEVAGVLPVSVAHFLVVLHDETTIGELNDLLASEGLAIAGSIPVMKVLMLRRNELTTIDDLALQMKRLRESVFCQAVAPNLGMSLPYDDPEPVPADSRVLGPMRAGESQVSETWSWDAPLVGTGTGGNNAFELSRIPQMWNWLDYGRRQKEIHGGHEVTVMEFAFYRGHEDSPTNVTYSAPLGSMARPANHGTGVLGVVGARRDNGVGLQGVTPLISTLNGVGYTTNTTTLHSYESVRLGQLASLICATTPPKVINISSGYPWNTNNPTTLVVSSATGETGAVWMDRLGDLWTLVFRYVNQGCSSDYLVVCSAGNDNGVDARYNSPMANIACRQDLSAVVPNFLTVENVLSNLVTSPISNRDRVDVGDTPGNSASAGGSRIALLAGTGSSEYRTSGGTSYAAPLVTGMASYLWTLDPDLTVQELKSLLIGPDTSRTVPTGANLVDGFAATLGIDLIRQNSKLHRALVDVDDGTLDGNLRREVQYFSEDPDTVHTPDQRRGDGRINMRDFRAFRDAWLQVIGETDHLDGSPTHFKKDLNFDGVVDGQPVSPAHPGPDAIAPPPLADAPEEAFYSRYDFNGNGLLDVDTDNYSAPTNALAPFKVDPDTPVERRNERLGILRDVDVLLSPDVWEQDEENVLLDYDSDLSFSPYFQLPPENWTTNEFIQLYLYTASLPYLWSCDLHIDMEAGDSVTGGNLDAEHPADLIADGLWLSSLSSFSKARLSEWEGVVTVPFPGPENIYSAALPADYPWVSALYKRTVGEEYHQYVIHFRPEPGEDIGLSVGFDEFQFYSNTRGDGPGLPVTYQDLPSVETIARAPGAGPYTTFFLPSEEFDQLEDAARDVAVSGLAGRLKTPDYLPGSPELEPIYTWENDLPGVTVRVYGLEAIYRPSN